MPLTTKRKISSTRSNISALLTPCSSISFLRLVVEFYSGQRFVFNSSCQKTTVDLPVKVCFFLRLRFYAIFAGSKSEVEPLKRQGTIKLLSFATYLQRVASGSVEHMRSRKKYWH